MPLQLYEKLVTMVLSKHELIIFGGFNLSYMDWARIYSQAQSSILSKFLVDNCMVQYVQEPTWEKLTLDLVRSTVKRLFGNVPFRNELGRADPRITEFIVGIPRSVPLW